VETEQLIKENEELKSWEDESLKDTMASTNEGKKEDL
jgi:hypothetical protein